MFFVIAAGCKFDKVTDFAYGLGFLALAVVEFVLGQTYWPRQILMLLAVALWAVRIAAYLLYRIMKIGHDARFDNLRNSVVKFGIFWFIQFVTVWINFLPQTLLFADAVDRPLGARDAVGFALFVVGLAVEMVADQQKFDFRNDANNKGARVRRGARFLLQLLDSSRKVVRFRFVVVEQTSELLVY